MEFYEFQPFFVDKDLDESSNWNKHETKWKFRVPGRNHNLRKPPTYPCNIPQPLNLHHLFMNRNSFHIGILGYLLGMFQGSLLEFYYGYNHHLTLTDCDFLIVETWTCFEGPRKSNGATIFFYSFVVATSFTIFQDGSMVTSREKGIIGKFLPPPKNLPAKRANSARRMVRAESFWWNGAILKSCTWWRKKVPENVESKGSNPPNGHLKSTRKK